MDVEEYLSEAIRKYIYHKRWGTFYPIQAAAIPKIILTEKNYILASKTASGKTEAAFLPILSKVNWSTPGVQVLYISPLIALINDQFLRIEELCKNLEICVTKWHGDANRTLKKKLIKNPSGIVLITPESLEALFVNAPYNVSRLWGNLQYIVIDEIHSFIGVERGIQLMSILSRINTESKNKIIIIGLSATIGEKNFYEAKSLIGDIDNTTVLLDPSKRDVLIDFNYFATNTKELSTDLVKDLYSKTKNYKTLIFPNSRGKTEEIAVKLKRISQKMNGHHNYFSHHSSIDKEIREHVESFAKHNERFNFCITCTSTLELGIDIGTIDKIVQLDSTYSVASLVQRMGRTGRKTDNASVISIYATDPWNLLQSLACWNLYKSDFLEPLKIIKNPYDILFHQMMSIVKQTNGYGKEQLINCLSKNHAFKFIKILDIKNIVNEAIKADYLELLDKEVILGLTGEEIVNSKDFYSVFKTEANFRVLNNAKKIGEIPFSPQVKIGENILLAATIWKIKDVDFKNNSIEVIVANDGQNPIFYGMGGSVHSKIREEMLRIIKGKNKFDEIDDKCNLILKKLREEFSTFTIKDFVYERPIMILDNKSLFFTFSGTKINRSLFFLFRQIGVNVDYNEHNSSFELETKFRDFETLKLELSKKYKMINKLLEQEILSNCSILNFSKFGEFLPLKYQLELLKERFFDFENTISFLDNLKLIPSS